MLHQRSYLRNKKRPLPEATTGRPVRTQGTQGSPRVCGRWGYAMVGRGGRGRHMGGVASEGLLWTFPRPPTAPRTCLGFQRAFRRQYLLLRPWGGRWEPNFWSLLHLGDPSGCNESIKQLLQSSCVEEMRTAQKRVVNEVFCNDLYHILVQQAVSNEALVGAPVPSFNEHQFL